jgi:tol-pal system protein YbgF
MADFRQEIAKVQSDNEKLNERVTNLEVTNSNRNKPQQGASDSSSQERPKLRVVHVAPGDDQDGDSEAGSEGAPEATDGEPTVIRAEGKNGSASARGRTGASSEQASREYEAAIDLVKKKQYDKALEAFDGFLSRYPGDANSDNAMYWRGECYYAKGDYARAIEQFEGLISRYPNGNKVPDAMLKLGLSQNRVGEREKAKQTFSELRRAHPRSEAAKKIPRE